MTATCEECGRVLITDQTDEAVIVYRCNCPTAASHAGRYRIVGEIRGDRVAVRDAGPDYLVTVAQ